MVPIFSMNNQSFFDNDINFREENGEVIYSSIPSNYLNKKGWNMERLNKETNLSEIIHIIGRDCQNGCIIEYEGIDGDNYFLTFGDSIFLTNVPLHIVKKLFKQNRWDIINMRPKRGILEFDEEKIYEYINSNGYELH